LAKSFDLVEDGVGGRCTVNWRAVLVVMHQVAREGVSKAATLSTIGADRFISIC
jgi:hypothetical protein